MANPGYDAAIIRDAALCAHSLRDGVVMTEARRLSDIHETDRRFSNAYREVSEAYAQLAPAAVAIADLDHRDLIRLEREIDDSKAAGLAGRYRRAVSTWTDLALQEIRDAELLEGEAL